MVNGGDGGGEVLQVLREKVMKLSGMQARSRVSYSRATWYAAEVCLGLRWVSGGCRLVKKEMIDLVGGGGEGRERGPPPLLRLGAAGVRKLRSTSSKFSKRKVSDWVAGAIEDRGVEVPDTCANVGS